VRSTTGHTFGGFASAPWSSTAGYITAAGCFLFLVENPHGDAPTCFECENNQNAMRGHSEDGPIFGGADLLITSDGSSSHIGFPYSYADTLGRGYDETFTGAQRFTPEDYEVWACE
jgi:hypothetical protein